MLPRRLEGVFGTAAMLCLLLPVVQVLPGREGAGIHEDSWDTLAMLAASPALRAAALVSVATMAVYNVAGGWVKSGGLFKGVWRLCEPSA